MISGINHVTISVKNLEESFSFYRDVLGFAPVMRSTFSAYFLCGTVWIALQEEKEKNHFTDRYSHIAFNIDEENYPSFVARLKENKVSEWQVNSTEGDSFYFCDPDGNRFEIHFSTLDARIEYGKKNWEGDVQWFV